MRHELGQRGSGIRHDAVRAGDYRARNLGAYVYMYNRLVRVRERVVLGRHLAQSAPDDQNQVGLFERAQDSRWRTQPQVAEVVWMFVGEAVLAAEPRVDADTECLRECD